MIGLNYLGKMGQLGNQMFQYAAIKGIAKNRGYDFCIPNHHEVVNDGLGNKLRIELFDVFEIPSIEYGLLETDNVIQESDFSFDEKLFNECPDNSCIVGFFQSEKYFKNIKSEIKQDFTFKKEYLESYDEVKGLFDNPIALHIRRGDFLFNSENHHNLSLSYYENALKQFDPDRQVVIFSDDTKWCKSQELFSDDRFLVCETGNSYVDLCIMSKCSDFIIANSTFSWWGAFLNLNRTICMPSKWFNEPMMYIQGFFFPGVTVIEV